MFFRTYPSGLPLEIGKFCLNIANEDLKGEKSKIPDFHCIPYINRMVSKLEKINKNQRKYNGIPSEKARVGRKRTFDHVDNDYGPLGAPRK